MSDHNHQKIVSIARVFTATSTLRPPEDKALAIEVTNKIVSLRTHSERNTYLGIGMFGLCQLQTNGGVTNSELLVLIGQLIESSLQVGAPQQTANPKQQLDVNKGDVIAIVE
jgi:hypothetical protein